MPSDDITEADETLAEAEAQLSPDHPVVRALRAERDAHARTKREFAESQEKQKKFGELKSRFPWLKESHLKGKPDEWEPWVSELNELRGQPAPEATDQEPAEKPVAPHPEEAAFAKAERVGPGRTGGDLQTYTPSEIQQIGLRDQAEALKLIQDGRMRSP